MIEHTKRMVPWTGPPPASWDDVTWPLWVLRDVMSSIEGFWAKSWGRGPHAYAENVLAPYNRGPGLGERVVMRVGGREIEGRWVFAWNNVGRIVTEDGTVHLGCTNGYFSIDELWDRSRSSGVALVVGARSETFDDWEFACGEAVERLRCDVKFQVDENNRRDRATPAACDMVAMAWIESRELLVRNLRQFGLSAAAAQIEARHRPTYTEIRNFLIGELDARRVVACAAAFRWIELLNRTSSVGEFDGLAFGRSRERGWL